MDGKSITQVKAKIFDQYNPKRTIEGTLVGQETYPCGFVLYTILLANKKIVYRTSDEFSIIVTP